MLKYSFPLLCGSLLFLAGCSQPNYYVFKTVKHRPPVERSSSANDTNQDRPSADLVASTDPSLAEDRRLADSPLSLDPVPARSYSITNDTTQAEAAPLTARQIRVQKRLMRRYDRAQKRWQEVPSADGPATTSLVLGILSVVLGLLGVILGPIAISSGSRALRIIDQYPEEEENKGIAKAGKILGIVGTVLGGIFLLILIGAALGG